MLKKCFGIISYLTDNEAINNRRIPHLNNLFNQLSTLWPDIDILIITQNWHNYEMPKIANKIIRINFDQRLGITQARILLRSEFLKLDYDYIIMLDDDANIHCDNDTVHLDYISEIDKHPGGFCFIHSGNHWHHHDDIARGPLNLCAISRELIEKEPMPDIDIEKFEAMEDDVYAEIFHNKYSELEFMPPAGIYHTHSFKGVLYKHYSHRELPPPTWYTNVGAIPWHAIWHNTNRIIEHLEQYKEIDIAAMKNSDVWERR